MVGNQIQQLADLLASHPYRAALEWHARRGLKLVPMDSQLALTLAGKALAVSQRSVADLRHVLEAEVDAFNAFVCAKLSKFLHKDEEEYPRGETPPEEERAKTIELVGYPETFLVPHLCEFAVASLAPDDLEGYAKRHRLPKAKQYAKDVLRLFQDSRKNG